MAIDGTHYPSPPTHTHTHMKSCNRLCLSVSQFTSSSYLPPDIVAVGFEHEVYAEVVPEGVGNFTICVITNVTLNGRRTASAVLHTEDVSAEG